MASSTSDQALWLPIPKQVEDGQGRAVSSCDGLPDLPYLVGELGAGGEGGRGAEGACEAPGDELVEVQMVSHGFMGGGQGKSLEVISGLDDSWAVLNGEYVLLDAKGPACVLTGQCLGDEEVGKWLLVRDNCEVAAVDVRAA
jgi:hypothetical protein